MRSRCKSLNERVRSLSQRARRTSEFAYDLLKLRRSRTEVQPFSVDSTETHTAEMQISELPQRSTSISDRLKHFREKVLKSAVQEMKSKEQQDEPRPHAGNNSGEESASEQTDARCTRKSESSVVSEDDIDIDCELSC
eukprot:TRINITY_DN12029_c0_g1_i1.p1 TRINITY_DN12029_c0_g1~~TRINITY_DN12029_c0_g1_i1.p1  ORF type:complete len:138 (-),score=19.74 TRINITY_DN12029_c0_g1_i1:78-491(-)